MNSPADHDDPQWRQAARAAGQLGADYPEWVVRPVRRHQGPGVEAWRVRDSEGTCAAVGTASEVRAVLEHTNLLRPVS
jgi:hypothetical protein